jgi:hypothetical protein
MIRTSTESGTENEDPIPGWKFEISRTRQGDSNVTSIASSQYQKQDQSTTSTDAGIQKDFNPLSENACVTNSRNDEFGSTVIIDSDRQLAKEWGAISTNDDGS